jgi:hypothetical protein
MKTKIALLTLTLGLCTLDLPAIQLTPFVYYGVDSTGAALTNAITIEAWPQTNTITGVSTNLVISLGHTYTPDTNGYVSNNIAPGNYRLTIAGVSRGMTFSIAATNATQNLAQVAGVPVVTFLNFSLAQFSDAGTAAYSNSTAFLPASLTNWTVAAITNAGTAAYSNSAAFLPASLTNWTVAAITNSGTAAYSNSTAFVLASSGSVGISGLATNNGIIWLSTNLAAGVAPDAVLPDGSILTGTNGAFYVRSNSTWNLK